MDSVEEKGQTRKWGSFIIVIGVCTTERPQDAALAQEKAVASHASIRGFLR